MSVMPGERSRATARSAERRIGVEIVVGVVMREVGEHLAAVGRFPPEELEGELVGVVPGHFLGDEVVESGALVDLRQLPVVAEGVGVPADAGGHSVEVFEGRLADEQLANERFAVGHVEVGLDPHAADDLPTALGEALLDLGIQGWIFVGHPLVVLRGGLGVGVVRIFVHQLGGGAKSALDDVDGFGPWPEPRGVDVGVAGEVKCPLLEQRLEGFQLRVRGLERGIEGGLIAIGECGQIDGGYGFREGIDVGGRARRERWDQHGVREELLAEVVGAGPVFREVDLRGHAIEALVIDGLENLDRDQNFVAGLGIVEEHDGLEIVAERHAAAIEIDDLGHRTIGAGVELEPDARAGEVVAVQRLWNFDFAAKPDGIFCGVAFDRKNRPTAVVETHGLTMSDVAGVKTPAVDRVGCSVRRGGRSVVRDAEGNALVSAVTSWADCAWQRSGNREAITTKAKKAGLENESLSLETDGANNHEDLQSSARENARREVRALRRFARIIVERCVRW